MWWPMADRLVLTIHTTILEDGILVELERESPRGASFIMSLPDDGEEWKP